MIAIILPLFVLSLISLLMSWGYASQTIMNRKPGVPFFPGNQESPGNVLFRPHQLTEKGLWARKQFFIWLSIFVGTLAASGIAAICYELRH